MQITAAVARERSGPFTLETLEIEHPRADEVLVEIVATGICHTDLNGRSGTVPFPLPGVLGHEGAGIVRELGDAVRELSIGDHVVMTGVAYCGACQQCRAANVAYCEDIYDLSWRGTRDDGTSALSKGDELIHAHFAGQSSFATYAIVKARHAVKVPGDLPLRLLAPFGCAVPTGVGAVVHSLGARAGSSVAVFGVGSVGLSSVMGARLAGSLQIIAIDPVLSRRELALQLGATNVVDPTDTDVTEAVMDLSGGKGVDYSIDTTGLPKIVEQAVDVLGILGAAGVLGGSPADSAVRISPNHLLFGGRTVRGILGGDAFPQTFVPELIEFWVQGRLPVDELITVYPLSAIEQAVADVIGGSTIKAVLEP